MSKSTAGQMRLQREAKMALKEIDTQIAKHGAVKDQNFICLPDPDNVYEWYFVVFGLEDDFKGGYYIGKVTCKNDYPQTAPNITIYTDNGKFRPYYMQKDGICLSISDFHQESWNPAWKVTQIVMGLISFWLSEEYTYGSIESYDYSGQPFGAKTSQLNKMFAMLSRQQVLDHEMYKKIFAPYAAAIGIDKEQDIPQWEEIRLALKKIEDDKIKAEEEKKIREAEAKIKAEQDRIQNLITNR